MLDLKERGIYKITCITTKKVYIGSTWKSFIKRFWQHEYELTTKRHKNKYLQNAWDKYGKTNFNFEIIESILDKNTLFEREQYWIDYYNACNASCGFNINKFASGGIQFPKDVIKRRSITLSRVVNEALVYYYKIKNGDIVIEDVPKKYKKLVSFRLNNVIWNKGLTKEDIDYSHLRVPKTITDKVLETRKQRVEKIRETATPYIDIYDNNENYLITFRSAKDIEEWSAINGNSLPMKLRNPNGRNGYSPYYLRACNVLNCCHGLCKSYKGLIFKFKDN